MNQREKILAVAAGAVVIAIGGNWFVREKILAPIGRKEILVENLGRALAAKEVDVARLRRQESEIAHWRKNALSAYDLAGAKTRYRKFLHQALDTAGVRNPTIGNPVDRAVKNHFTSVQYKVAANCSLTSLARLLFQFSRSDLLHRVNQITVTPNWKDDRLVDFKLDFDVEVLAFTDAIGTRTLATFSKNADGRVLDDYRYFAEKNIFQPTQVRDRTAVREPSRETPVADERGDIRVTGATSSDGKYEVWFFNAKSKKHFAVPVGKKLDIPGMSAVVVRYDSAESQVALQVKDKIGIVRLDKPLSSWKESSPAVAQRPQS